MTTLRRALGLATLTLALGACAGTPDGEPATPSVQIQVVNEITPTTALTVHLLEGEERAPLGTVVPSGRRTFRYHLGDNGDAASDRYRLHAETGTGREITSPPFTLAADLALVWNVETNTVERR